jgi:hypothetical protein
MTQASTDSSNLKQSRLEQPSETELLEHDGLCVLLEQLGHTRSATTCYMQPLQFHIFASHRNKESHKIREDSKALVTSTLSADVLQPQSEALTLAVALTSVNSTRERVNPLSVPIQINPQPLHPQKFQAATPRSPQCQPEACKGYDPIYQRNFKVINSMGRVKKMLQDSYTPLW